MSDDAERLFSQVREALAELELLAPESARMIGAIRGIQAALAEFQENIQLLETLVSMDRQVLAREDRSGHRATASRDRHATMPIMHRGRTMAEYKIGHAALAHRRFLLGRDHTRSEIEALPRGGWLDDGPDRFTYFDRSDSNLGKVACKVQFLNEEGGAEVTLAGGDGGVVNIGNDKQDEPEEVEEDWNDVDVEED